MHSSTSDKPTGKTIPEHEISKRRVGGPDSIGNIIQNIFQTHLDQWIVYKSDSVHVEIANELRSEDPQLLESYQNRAAQIQDLKAQVNRLLKEVTNKEKYEGAVADGIAMALRNDVTAARRRLEEALEQINNDRYIAARFRYLKYTFLCALPLLVIFGTLIWVAVVFKFEGDTLLLAGTAGLLGTIFSIAIAIHARAVGIDTDSRALLTDCFLRMVIGIISGCFLQLLLEAGAFPTISVGDAVISKDGITWRVIVAVGFIAGFSERLVPNLLQQSRIVPLLDRTDTARKVGKAHRGAQAHHK